MGRQQPGGTVRHQQCCPFLPAGQRRLWEAVKRRKALCKRKSWMSKVGGSPGYPVAVPGAWPSLDSCSLAVPLYNVQATLLQVLSGSALVWQWSLTCLARGSPVSSLGAFPRACSAHCGQGPAGGRGRLDICLGSQPSSLVFGLLWSLALLPPLPRAHLSLGYGSPWSDSVELCHCLEDNEGGSEPARPASLPRWPPPGPSEQNSWQGLGRRAFLAQPAEGLSLGILWPFLGTQSWFLAQASGEDESVGPGKSHNSSMGVSSDLCWLAGGL